MTDREKAIVMAYTGIAMLSGDKIKEFYKYLDELYGRPVYTHEIAILDIQSKARQDFIELCRTEEKKEKWIPVSERLPEELEEVNITWVNTDPEPYYENIKGVSQTGSAIYFKGRWYWYSAVCKDYLAEYGFSPNDEMDDAIKVIVWMPLPEPYNKER